MKNLLRDFWEGASESTPASWIGILVFCGLEVLACCIALQPRYLAKMDRFYLMESPRDEYAELSFRLIALRYSKLTMKHVAFFGPSHATRSLVAHDDDTMSEELEAALGAPARFDVFTTNNQRLEDALQGVDQLPPSYHGAFVLQIHDSKDDYRGGPADHARNRRRLALPSTPSILPIWRSQGVHYLHTGIFFLDNFAFFSARRSALMRMHPVGSDWAWNGKRDQAKFNEARARFEKLLEEAEMGNPPASDNRRSPTFTKSRKVMMKLAAVLRKRQLPFMLIEAPRFPSRDLTAENRIELFHEDARRFCKETGATFYDPNPELDLSDEDFQDAAHLGSAAKRRAYTDLLLAHIVDVLNGPTEPPKDQAPSTDPAPPPTDEAPKPASTDTATPEGAGAIEPGRVN